jgi:hypothetical protein
VKAKSFLDTSDRDELSEILTSERLKTAEINVPPKVASAKVDPDLDEILDHVRKAKTWQGPKKKIKNRKKVRQLARK